MLRVPGDERLEARRVLLGGERNLGILECKPMLHLGEDISRRGRWKPRVVAAGRNDRHPVALGEVHVQCVQCRRGEVETQDAADLEHVQNARDSAPTSGQPIERAPIRSVVGVIGIAQVDDEQVGGDEDQRRPRLSLSASRQER